MLDLFYNKLKNQKPRRRIKKMPKKYGKRKQTPNLQQTELYDKVTKIQSSILSELQSLNKKRNLKFDCVHCYEQPEQEYDPRKNYYDEFWKSYLMNIVIMKRYEEYREWMRKISKKISNIETLYNERKQIMQPIDSKRRRKALEGGSGQFECVQCGKKYKDNESLKIHLHIKHGREEIKHEAKIEELNHSYIEHSDQDDNNYYQEEEE